ncbi:Hypothetical protein POVR1_LOCUS390 [uncultured virus]|nr:Hypothetical protein POVR1_LOCUS390 [uncultured virus]
MDELKSGLDVLLKQSMAKTRINNFGKFLRDHPRIEMKHMKKYSEKDIKHLLRSEEIKKKCPHCGYGTCNRYAVETTDKTFFLLEYYTGCLTYSGHEVVKSFEDKAALKEYIDSKKYFVESSDDAGSSSGDEIDWD